MSTPAGPPDFRTLLEALPTPYLVLLPDPPRFTIVAASEAYLTMTLVDRAAAIGRGVFEVFPDENPEDEHPTGAIALRESLATVLRTGEPQRMPPHRYDLRLPDGSWSIRWWAALNAPVLGPDGEVRWILHHAEDVTESTRRARFSQLAAVLERLTAAQDVAGLFEVIQSGSRELVGADGASLVLREEGECHYVAPGGSLWAGQRFPLGATAAGWAILHRRTATVENVLTDDRIPVERYATTPVRSLVMVPVGAPEPFAAIGTYWFAPRRHDPEEVAVLESLARVAGQVIERARATEEARQAEAAWRESETRYRTLFESIDAGFCIIEVIFDDRGHPADFRFLEVNDAFERQTGLADAVGRRMREIAPEHEEHWFELFGHVARTGARVRFENPARALGGRWFDVEAFRVGEPEQRHVGVLFRDVTERVKAEERVREAGRLEAIGALAGGVAHEANNQMSIVLGFADFVLRRGDIPEAVREDVEQMQRAAERTALITGQLLAFGRRQVLHPAVVELNGTIESLAPALRRTLGVDTTLTLDLAAGAGHVLADARQLEQVLINLTLNARDAMPRGGTLTIRTSDVSLPEPAAAPVPAAGEPIPPGRYVRLTVEDTGQGIDPAIRHRVFEPFFTTKPLGHGTGLGLASVYGIVKQTGGYIDVDNAPGGGARFTIHLPRVREPAAAGGDAEPRGPGGHGETVLVVEDEPAVRSIIARILEEDGFTVVTAEDGHAALALLERERIRPQLVLTDVAMPRMGGRALANELGVRYPGVPVVFLSGYTEGDVEPAHPGAEPAEFVQKPVSPAQLLRVVRARARR